MDKAGRVTVDKHFCTSVPSIRAIGDAIAGPMLAHKVSTQRFRLDSHGIERILCIYRASLPSLQPPPLTATALLSSVLCLFAPLSSRRRKKASRRWSTSRAWRAT